MFMAFLLRENPPDSGLRPEVLIGLVVAAAGLGNAGGVAVASLLRNLHPGTTVVLVLVLDAAAALVATVFYGVLPLVALGLCAGLAQSLAKFCLDATIQSDVPDQGAGQRLRPQRHHAAAGVGRGRLRRHRPAPRPRPPRARGRLRRARRPGRSSCSPGAAGATPARCPSPAERRRRTGSGRCSGPREFRRPADGTPDGWPMKLHRPPTRFIGRPMKLRRPAGLSARARRRGRAAAWRWGRRCARRGAGRGGRSR